MFVVLIVETGSRHKKWTGHGFLNDELLRSWYAQVVQVESRMTSRGHTFFIFTALLLGPVLRADFLSSQTISAPMPPSSCEATLLDRQPVILISSEGPRYEARSVNGNSAAGDAYIHESVRAY